MSNAGLQGNCQQIWLSKLLNVSDFDTSADQNYHYKPEWFQH